MELLNVISMLALKIRGLLHNHRRGRLALNGLVICSSKLDLLFNQVRILGLNSPGLTQAGARGYDVGGRDGGTDLGH